MYSCSQITGNTVCSAVLTFFSYDGFTSDLHGAVTVRYFLGNTGGGLTVLERLCENTVLR